MIHRLDFPSRESKNIFLKKIINELKITIDEKELYNLSIEILDDDNFEIFFSRILTQVSESENAIGSIQTIEPFSSTLL
jgi:hypothetical protein